MDTLEAQLLLQSTKLKVPWFAALLGFFFPTFGALYVRRVGLAILFLAIDFMNLILSIIGIGLVLALFFRLFASYFAYKGAVAINTVALAALIDKRKQDAEAARGQEQVSLEARPV